jgi:hypothetical protein
MIHFNNTTGKNVGELQVTKLANFLGLNEATLRSLKRTNPAKFEREHLGALCQANGISKKALEVILNKGFTMLTVDEIQDIRADIRKRELNLKEEKNICYVRSEWSDNPDNFIDYKSVSNAEEEVKLMNELLKREDYPYADDKHGVYFVVII